MRHDKPLPPAFEGLESLKLALHAGNSWLDNSNIWRASESLAPLCVTPRGYKRSVQSRQDASNFLRIFDLFLLISPRPLKEDAMVRSRFLSVEAGLALLASIAHVQASDILPREISECVRHVYLHTYQCINDF